MRPTRSRRSVARWRMTLGDIDSWGAMRGALAFLGASFLVALYREERDASASEPPGRRWGRRLLLGGFAGMLAGIGVMAASLLSRSPGGLWAAGVLAGTGIVAGFIGMVLHGWWGGGGAG